MAFAKLPQVTGCRFKSKINVFTWSLMVRISITVGSEEQATRQINQGHGKTPKTLMRQVKSPKGLRQREKCGNREKRSAQETVRA